MKLILSGIIFVGISIMANATSIPISGEGTFSLDNFYDTSANLCFSGANISGCIDGIGIGPTPPTVIIVSSIGQYSLQATSYITVDNVTSPFFRFMLGNGNSDFAAVYDKQGGILAYESLSDSIEITSYNQVGGTRFINNQPYQFNHNWSASGTFVIYPIVATPEPSTGLMCIGGLLFLLIGKLKR